MRKNAGIKSKKEAAQRLIDGERFKWKSTELFFDELMKRSPFVALYKNTKEDITTAFDCFDQWEVEIDWRENIGKGVLCWVWDRNKEEKIIRVITGLIEKRGSQQYITINNIGFNYAEPMTEAEVMEYVLK